MVHWWDAISFQWDLYSSVLCLIFYIVCGVVIGKDLISDASCTEPYEWKDKTDSEWEFSPNVPDADDTKFHVSSWKCHANCVLTQWVTIYFLSCHAFWVYGYIFRFIKHYPPTSFPLLILVNLVQVVAYDFGVKQNILRRLTSYGCKITVVPSTYPASKVLDLNPDGILFSNGPGDPSAVPYAVKSVQDLVGKVPVFGICMGHQLLGQALGGTTFKMKFGHHGGNHPVRHLPTGRVEISAQVIVMIQVHLLTSANTCWLCARLHDIKFCAEWHGFGWSSWGVNFCEPSEFRFKCWNLGHMPWYT